MTIERVLIPFPGSRPDGSGLIDITLDREGEGCLAVTFRASGFVGGVTLPERGQPSHRNGLWEHTCCEVFAMREDGSYAEFNLAPSADWAAYGFTGYRQEMSVLDAPRPRIRSRATDDGFVLEAFIPWRDWPEVASIAVSAVIETPDGEKTYWALAHASDKPDFHHPASFILTPPVLDRP